MLSILIIKNSNGLLIKSFGFLIGASASCDDGTNACIPNISQENPPLTLLLIVPVTFV